MAATYHAGYGWPVDDQSRETIAAVVLAAGEGRRFGAPKQLHLIEGITMLERVLIAVERSGIATRLVVLGSHADEITAEVPLHGAVAVPSPRWADGQAASLRAGLEALPEPIDEALVVLVDIGDFSYQDAADILGVPIGTVMSRLHRGRRALKQALASRASEDGHEP